MRGARTGALGLVLLGGLSTVRPPAPLAQEKLPPTPPSQVERSEVIRKVLPAVVSITTRKEVVSSEPGANAAGAEAGSVGSYGTGFIIDPSGLIVTNFHVVKGASEIDVTLSDGTWLPARFVTATQLIDVAVLKVEIGHPLPALTWGDSGALEVGEPVLAIGNALDVGISVSGGLISALNRNIRLSPYDDFIQTDAAINHGNSGGPLVDMRGEVVGVNTAIFSPTDSSSGVGFAISSRGERTVIKRLTEYGWLRPGWIGIKVQQLTPAMSAALGKSRPEGSIVALVNPDGPAQAAGLRVGDVILRVGDTVPTDERALLRAIAETPIGATVSLGIVRDGAAQDVEVAVKEWPRKSWETIDPPISFPPTRRRIPPDLGITLGSMEAVGNSDGAAARPGVAVTKVAGNTDAAERGLTPGDVILRVGGKTVSSPSDVQAGFDTARAERRSFVLLLVDPKEHRTPGPEWRALRVSDD